MRRISKFMAASCVHGLANGSRCRSCSAATYIDLRLIVGRSRAAPTVQEKTQPIGDET